MRYLLLVSHGGFAEGLKTSLAMFAEDKMDQVVAVGLANGSSVDEFAIKFRESIEFLAEDDSVVVLADIIGGSPLTTALNVLSELGKLNDATVMGGMNLSMALTSIVMKDVLSGEDLVNSVFAEAQGSIQEFKVVSEEADDDEDDI